MLRFLTRGLAILVLTVAGLLSSLVAIPGVAAATMYYVNASTGNDASTCASPSTACKTIQAAVNKAAAGDTINVAAGTYIERVTVNKSVTIDGAQAGINATTRGVNPSTESILNGPQTAFYVTANSVTIDGFTVQNTTSANVFGAGIVLAPGTTGATIQNNIIQDNIAGLFLSNTGTLQSIIRDNFFNSNNQPGPVSGSAIYTDEYVAGGAVSNVLIDSNGFYNNANAAIGLSSNSVGSGYANITISNNILDTNGRGIYAYLLTTSAITNNLITNSTTPTDGGSSVAIGLYGNVSGVTITQNLLQTGAHYGIRIGSFLTVSNSDISVNFNRIVGFTGDAVYIDSGGYSGTLDATNDWWGCNTGPNTTGCGTTSGTVNSNPWLVLSVTASPSTIASSGYPSDTSTITASLTVNSDGVDTSGSGHVPDGTPVSFATTDGSLSSTSKTTVTGTASVTLTASASPSTATVSTMVDQQSVSTTVSWSVPASTSGAHVIAINRRNPQLQLNALVNSRGAAKGLLRYTGSDGVTFFSMQINSVVTWDNQATITGSGLYLSRTGVQFVTFRLDVTADGSSSGGTIELSLSNGYDSGVVPVNEVRL